MTFAIHWPESRRSGLLFFSLTPAVAVDNLPSLAEADGWISGGSWKGFSKLAALVGCGRFATLLVGAGRVFKFITPVGRGEQMTTSDSNTAKIQTNFQALSAVASSLNAASDEFTQVIGALDEALKKLNIGLTVWVIFGDRGDENDPAQYNCDQIGYCKVDGKWGIALRHIWGHEGFDAHNEDGPWLFKDGPREMRLRSVDKIPDLIKALSEEASSTTKRIQEKTKEVRELAGAITSVTTEAKVKAKSVTLAERIVSGQKQPLAGIAKTPTIAVSDLLGRDNKTGGK
jgi:prefoldin subunit 5